MKVLSCVIFLFLSAFVSAAEWETDFDKALKKSAKEGKPMLVNFTGSDWCGWCIKLDKEVFSTKEFTDWADKNVILVKLDFPRKSNQTAEEKKRNNELVKKYGVRGYPTILFIDGKGNVIGKSGYLKGGPSAWTKSAEGILKKTPDLEFEL